MSTDDTPMWASLYDELSKHVQLGDAKTNYFALATGNLVASWAEPTDPPAALMVRAAAKAQEPQAVRAEVVSVEAEAHVVAMPSDNDLASVCKLHDAACREKLKAIDHAQETASGLSFHDVFQTTGVTSSVTSGASHPHAGPHVVLLAAAGAGAGGSDDDFLDIKSKSMIDAVNKCVNQGTNDANTKAIAAAGEARKTPMQDPQSNELPNEANSGLTRAQTAFNRVVSRIPAGRGPTLVFGSMRADDAYSCILQDIKITLKPGGADAIKAALDKYKSAASSRGKIDTEATKEFLDYKNMKTAAGLPFVPYEQFLIDFGYTNKLQAAIDEQYAQFAQFRSVCQENNLQMDLVSALTRANANQSHFYDMTPDSKSLANVLRDKRNKPEGSEPDLAFEINKSHETSSYSKTNGGASASYGFFVSVSAGASREETRIDTSEMTISVAFQGYTTVMITDSNWFNGAVLTKYTGAEARKLTGDASCWASGSPFNTGAAVPYDDRSDPKSQLAVFPCFPTQALLAYKPTIHLSMSESHYTQTKTTYSGGGGFRFGPFSFGGSGGHVSVNTDSSSQKTSVTISSTVDDFQLAGIVYQYMPPNDQQ